MADRDGFDAVTLRSIARELKVHVTSLYNHVPTKDAITDGVVELLVAEAKLPTDPRNWEDWVRGFTKAMVTLASTHPGAITAMQRTPVQGPDASASFEAALRAFRKAGFTPAEAYGAVKATSIAALGLATEQALMSWSLGTGTPFPQTDVEALPAEEFPHMHEIAALPDDVDTADQIVETLVAGFRARLRRAKRP